MIYWSQPHMRLISLLLIFLPATLLISCFTTEEEKEGLKIGNIEPISMDAPPEAIGDGQKQNLDQPLPRVILRAGTKGYAKPDTGSKVLKTFDKWQEIKVKNLSEPWSELHDGTWVESKFIGE